MDRLSKEQMYLKMAEIVGERSTCLRLKVGTVVTNSEMTNIVSIGYNGGYSGGPEIQCTGEEGNCKDLHSEVNALVKCNEQGKVMFITDSPCEMCSKLIVNKGIEKVFYLREYRNQTGLDILKRSGIKIQKLSLKDDSFWKWLAGFIDGDGSIDIKKQKKGEDYYVYDVLLNACNTHYETLEYISKNIGKGKIQKMKVRSRKHKPVYDWRISGEEARTIIEKIYPYLVTKRKAAELAILLKKDTKNRKRPSDSELKKRRNIFDEMKLLVKRGIE